MTRPHSLQPPRLAMWLLEQFSPLLQNPPLTGDLIEAFRQGRSSAWCWRQVLAAILIALPNLLRRQWGRFAYSVACSGLTSAAWFFMSPSAGHGSALPQVFALYAKGYGIRWPWSLVYQIAFLTAFEAAILAVALGLYLAFARALNLQNLFQGWMVVVVVLATSNVAVMFLSVLLSVAGLQFLAGWALLSTPAVFALWLGMGKANPGGRSRTISA